LSTEGSCRSGKFDGPVADWLLEDKNPSTRYLTLTQLLEVSNRSKEAVEARSKIPDWQPVRKILARQKKNGSWDKDLTWYVPKYKSTIWQLIILSQTGIDPTLPCIQRMCEYAFRYQVPSGGFHSGMRQNLEGDWASLAGCINGNVIAALTRLGWAHDRRVRKAVDHLLSFQEPDGGWGCRSFGHHRRDKHSCFMGTICALDGLVEYSQHVWRKTLCGPIESACEFLLMHRLYKADHHGWGIIRGDFTRLRAPWLVSYDILRGLRALTRAGVVDDERMNDALSLLVAKRNSNGCWAREAHWPSTTYSSFGRLGAEDKWVTLNALLALKETSRVAS
jgi:hypothetical protein